MGNRIRQLRKSQGLTLTQLAEKVGTTNQQLSHLEKGRRRLTQDWMERIARGLNCRPIELLEETVDKLSVQERAFIKIYRKLSSEQQEALYVATAAIIDPNKNT